MTVKYERILRAVVQQPWAIEPIKGRAIVELLALRASGEHLAPEEIEARIRSDRAGRIAAAPGAVAVIPMMGVMSQRLGLLGQISGGVSTEAVGRALDEALGNDDVKAVILQIDSPGGNIHGVQALADKVYNARSTKPVIAIADSLAASAAYWVGSQAEEFVVAPHGDVGSIGVYSMHDDISKMLENAGEKITFVYAGKYKVEGNPFEPLSETARADMQARVDAAYSDFVAAVARGRGVERGEVLEHYGEGRLVRAPRALEAGMVDRIATLEETIARYTVPAGSPRGNRTRALALNAKAKL